MKVPEHFGELVFDDTTMRSRLPRETYEALKRTINQGRSLDINVANVVANAMKNWAVERGATHYTHWFQPMTGITAEKHNSFISPTPDGRVIMEFSGSELVRGESDASSFPSGGLRATFEARGYTAWDPTSYAFIKGRTLCIPTAFCSYGGHALDKKTPLLRSMEAINRQALRILRLFGNTNVSYVRTCVGAEQEYFLIDKAMFDKRPDLKFCGRTLFGAKPPKGQELEDHYYGPIKPRVAAFMEELNDELWKVGILAKTQHNEVAPSQHELAPIFTTTNIATDHNQLIMELMKQVASKHGMVCLLHEKPFAGVNGSGKHNNWSLATDTGINLLTPGDTPYENAQFLLFLVAVIQAVDDYQDLLRLSVATAGNDLRLGANEAPPNIISVFLGEELSAVLDAIEHNKPYNSGKKEVIKLGVHVLPKFPKDTTDRNRTSPFAFTGNKFEFRMVGASNSIACANIMINTAVAESLRQYADYLEAAPDFIPALQELIRSTIIKHKRIIFNGNNYDPAWQSEAVGVRGLLNLKTTPDCMPCLLSKKNVELLVSHRVYSEPELRSRCEIILENYCKVINIEALTIIEMARKQILPAVEGYCADLANAAALKRAIVPDIELSYEKGLIQRLTRLINEISERTDALEAALCEIRKIETVEKQSCACRDLILTKMNELRAAADEAETIVAGGYWPYPTYGELLFGVR
jgi:glutamine synthetase